MSEQASWTKLQLPADGRQSARAVEVQRGVCRHFAAQGVAPLTEVTLANGRRADIIALGRGGEIAIVEIKTSLADWRADAKWPDYHAYCDRLFFAVPADFPRHHLPATTGLLVADRYGAEVLREAPMDKLSAARRKAVTLRIARAGALRLSHLADPQAGIG